MSVVTSKASEHSPRFLIMDMAHKILDNQCRGATRSRTVRLCMGHAYGEARKCHMTRSAFVFPRSNTAIGRNYARKKRNHWALVECKLCQVCPQKLPSTLQEFGLRTWLTKCSAICGMRRGQEQSDRAWVRPM